METTVEIPEKHVLLYDFFKRIICRKSGSLNGRWLDKLSLFAITRLMIKLQIAYILLYLILITYWFSTPLVFPLVIRLVTNTFLLLSYSMLCLTKENVLLCYKKLESNVQDVEYSRVNFVLKSYVLMMCILMFILIMGTLINLVLDSEQFDEYIHVTYFGLSGIHSKYLHVALSLALTFVDCVVFNVFYSCQFTFIFGIYSVSVFHLKCKLETITNELRRKLENCELFTIRDCIRLRRYLANIGEAVHEHNVCTHYLTMPAYGLCIALFSTGYLLLVSGNMQKLNFHFLWYIYCVTVGGVLVIGNVWYVVFSLDDKRLQPLNTVHALVARQRFYDVDLVIQVDLLSKQIETSKRQLSFGKYFRFDRPAILRISGCVFNFFMIITQFNPQVIDFLTFYDRD